VTGGGKESRGRKGVKKSSTSQRRGSRLQAEKIKKHGEGKGRGRGGQGNQGGERTKVKKQTKNFGRGLGENTYSS